MAHTYPRVHQRDTPIYRDRDVDSEHTYLRVYDENPAITRSQQVIQLIIGIISSLLLLRFLLALFGANSANTFVSFIYGVTAPLISPFRGLFNLSPAAGASTFEVETLAATIIYILLGVGLIRLLDIFRRNETAV